MKTPLFSFFPPARWAVARAFVLALAATTLAACSKDRQENPRPVTDATTASADSFLSSLGPFYPIPDTLKAPANAVLLASLFAAGVQVYEVRATAANPDQYEWAFVAPEATLYGADHFVVGSHYAGPTWESNDGSTVVGRVIARQDAPRSTRDIPWLLLASRATTGTGIFNGVSYVQRLNTRGGQAPAARTATKATLGVRARIPYVATYTFYGVK